MNDSCINPFEFLAERSKCGNSVQLTNEVLGKIMLTLDMKHCPLKRYLNAVVFVDVDSVVDFVFVVVFVVIVIVDLVNK